MEELKIVLSLDEVNLILGSLSELPYKTVSGLISKVTAQAESQLKARQEKKAAEVE
jgi:hypothetical protein